MSTDRETDTATTQRLSARITGRVQGVGFRNFTQRTASRLGLVGWVRNEADGSVRLEAEGAPDDLDALRTALQEGPRMAHVESVDADVDEATGAFETFRVRR